MRFFNQNTSAENTRSNARKHSHSQAHRKTGGQRRIRRKKTTAPLPMGRKGQRGLLIYAVLVFALFCFPVTSLATSDPIQVVNNLSDFIFGLVKATGMIMLGFGIVQIGLSLKSHDPSQRANGFLTLAGGVVITFAKEILTIITG